MTLFRMTSTAIERVPETSFEEQGVRERFDLQRLLKANVAVIARDVLIIAEEFCQWQDSKRRIDLLGVDRSANLVVVELKRDQDGGHMELQALRYAAMVSNMTFDRAVDVFQRLLDERGDGRDARIQLLEFLGWDEPREEDFGTDTRVILVAADFRKELTTTVLWLNDCGLDLRCVRMQPYVHGSEVLIDVQQIIPLPEAAEYMEGLREKTIDRREAIRRSGEPTGYWFMNVGDKVSENRSWEDRMKYGFMSAGGSKQYIDAIRKLRPGDRVFAYVTQAGYVGLGEVTSEAVPFPDFKTSSGKPLAGMELATPISLDAIHDAEQGEWCVGIDWLATVERDKAVLRSLAYRGTLKQIRRKEVVEQLLEEFGIPDHVGADPRNENRS
jgi:hypothetical protein